MPKFLDVPSWYASNGRLLKLWDTVPGGDGYFPASKTDTSNGNVGIEWKSLSFNEGDRDGSFWAADAPGEAGQVLESSGAGGGAPVWVDTIKTVNGRAIQENQENTDIYAPVNSGISGYWLGSNGNGVAPSWRMWNVYYYTSFSMSPWAMSTQKTINELLSSTSLGGICIGIGGNFVYSTSTALGSGFILAGNPLSSTTLRLIGMNGTAMTTLSGSSTIRNTGNACYNYTLVSLSGSRP